MPGRSPTGPLIHEHRVIERMLGVMRAHLTTIAETGRDDTIAIERMADFVLSYADGCHHRKEEEVLFARLATKELDPELAIEMQELIDEHAYIRGLARRMDEANRRYASAGGETVLAEIARAMESLLEAYPIHVEKEERHFFKACLAYLDDEERAATLREYDDLDRRLIHETYLRVVKDLEASGE